MNLFIPVMPRKKEKKKTTSTLPNPPQPLQPSPLDLKPPLHQRVRNPPRPLDHRKHPHERMMARAAPEKGQPVAPHEGHAPVAETDVVADAADVELGVGRVRGGCAAGTVAAPDAFGAGVFGVDGGGALGVVVIAVVVV